MQTRVIALALCLLFAALLAFGQVGNGTITGTVTDQAGAVVAGAPVQIKNTDTGVVYSGASTAAGNYTISDLPVGRYSITVTVQGFKTYTHTNLAVEAAQTLQENVPLQVGSSSESVTVTAESTLLKTESGDLATNITLTQIDELPLMGIGVNNSGTSGYRNPYNVIVTIPGAVNYNAMNAIGLNVNNLTTRPLACWG
jgi:Carboxypeptidase regulatory-like domain